MDVAGRWLAGESVSEICSTFVMFEGNLLRGLLKINTLLTEWQTLASFCEVSVTAAAAAVAQQPTLPLLRCRASFSPLSRTHYFFSART